MQILNGHICRSMGALDFVLAVIVPFRATVEKTLALIVFRLCLDGSLLRHYRIFQEFPDIRLPPDYPVVPTGREKQEPTVFLKSADGCEVLRK